MHWDVLCWLVRLFNKEKGPVEGERGVREKEVRGSQLEDFLVPNFSLVSMILPAPVC